MCSIPGGSQIEALGSVFLALGPGGVVAVLWVGSYVNGCVFVLRGALALLVFVYAGS